MPNQGIPKRHSTKRRRLTIAMMVATVLSVAIGLASPALAWQRYYAATSNVPLSARIGGSPIQYIGKGTPTDVSCAVLNGPNVVYGNRTVDRLTGGQWVADGYLTTPSVNAYPPGVGPCPGYGTTTPANGGVAGQCVWYALERFRTYSGVYPQTSGDAWNIANSARAYGWATSTVPRINSIVVFQPWQNGAGSYGHVAYVQQVSGPSVYIAEMNGPAPSAVGVAASRWITPVGNVQYVYAP